MRAHVDQEKRTRLGKPNTGSTCFCSHALVSGSAMYNTPWPPEEGQHRDSHSQHRGLNWCQLYKARILRDARQPGPQM